MRNFLTYILLIFYSCLIYGQRKTTLSLRDKKSIKIPLIEFNDNILLKRNEYGIKLFKKTPFFKGGFNKGNIEDYYCINKIFVYPKVMLEDLKFYPKDTLFSNLFFLKVSNNKLFETETELSFIDKNKMTLTQSNLLKFYHYDKLDSYGSLFKTIHEFLGFEDIKYLISIELTNNDIEFIVTKRNEVYVYLVKNSQIMTLDEFDIFYKNGGIKRFKDNIFDRM